jgi:hypothetical protein
MQRKKTDGVFMLKSASVSRSYDGLNGWLYFTCFHRSVEILIPQLHHPEGFLTAVVLIFTQAHTTQHHSYDPSLGTALVIFLIADYLLTSLGR